MEDNNFKWYSRYGFSVKDWLPYIQEPQISRGEKHIIYGWKYYENWTLLDKIKIFIFGELSMIKITRIYYT